MLRIGRLLEGAAVLQIRPWKSVFEWLMSGSEEEYKQWSQYDLVLGMVDYTMEYMLVARTHVYINHSLFFLPLSRECNRITLDNYTDFDLRMFRLSTHTRIWPPLTLSKAAANKWQMIQFLDRVASRVTNTPRPETRLWEDRGIPQGMVLKRCCSAFQEHIYLPEVGSSQTRPTRAALLETSILPGREWMVQSWMPLLRTWGEFKVYFIEMKIVHIAVARVRTRTGKWEITTPDRILTLSEMKCVA